MDADETNGRWGSLGFCETSVDGVNWISFFFFFFSKYILYIYKHIYYNGKVLIARNDGGFLSSSLDSAAPWAYIHTPIVQFS